MIFFRIFLFVSHITKYSHSELLVHQCELLYAGSCNVANPGNFSNNVMSFNYRIVFSLTRKKQTSAALC